MEHSGTSEKSIIFPEKWFQMDRFQLSIRTSIHNKIKTKIIAAFQADLLKIFDLLL